MTQSTAGAHSVLGMIGLIVLVIFTLTSLSSLIARFLPASVAWYTPLPQLAALAPVFCVLSLIAFVICLIIHSGMLAVINLVVTLVLLVCNLGYFGVHLPLPGLAGQAAAQSQPSSTASSAAAAASGTSPAASSAAAAASINLMTLNVYVGRSDAAQLLREVQERGINVLCLQEVTSAFVEALDAAGIADILPMRAGSAPGDLIYSSLPLEDCVVDAVGYAGAAMAAATVDLGTQKVRVVSVHTCAPVPGVEDLWYASLLGVAHVRMNDPYATADVPYILAGDFNASLDHAAFRDILEQGYVDAALAAGKGYRGTWPALGGSGTSVGIVAIDHVLIPAGASCSSLNYVRVAGSDHIGLAATVQLPA